MRAVVGALGGVMSDHESAAFGGAASVTKPEPETRVTYEEVMAQPWCYPQGRVPLPASHEDRITPPEDDDWKARAMTSAERWIVITIILAMIFAAASMVGYVFKKAFEVLS